MQLNSSLPIVSERFDPDPDRSHAFRLGRRAADLIASLANRLALLTREQLSQRFLMLTQHSSHPADEGGAFRKRPRFPRRKSRTRSTHGSIELLRVGCRTTRKHRPRSRIYNL